MKKESKNNIRLGIFVIVAFILFTIGVYNIGSKDNIFSSTIKVSVVFKNAQGLRPGNAVRYVGINVGSVDDIVILNDSILRVDMRLETSVQEHMKKDAQAYIGSDGLVGDKVVNIVPGKKSSETITSGDMIKTLDRVATDDMMASLDRTNENILLISDNLLKITNQMVEGDGVAANLISNKKMSEDLAATMHNLKALSASLSKTSRELATAIDEVNEGKGTLGYLLKDTSLEQNIDHLFAEIDSSLLHKTEPILTNVEASSQHIKSMSGRLDSLLREIDLNEGMLGLLLKDTAIVYQTNDMIEDATVGVEMFNENMEALKHNFLFRRYFKKKAKREKKAAKEKE